MPQYDYLRDLLHTLKNKYYEVIKPFLLRF